jgi:putative transposase
VQVMIQEHAISVRQACRATRLARSAYYAPRRPRDDSAVIAAIQGFVSENPGQGFDKLYPVLWTQGFGKCRLYSLYKALKLNMKRRGKRRLPARVKAPLVIPARPNEIWSADFMSDALWSGRRFRTFNVIDDCAREALRIEIDTNLPAKRIVRALDELVEIRGKPRCSAHGQRPRTHQRGAREVGTAARRRATLYPAWSPHAERSHRTFQSNLPAGGAQLLRL